MSANHPELESLPTWKSSAKPGGNATSPLALPKALSALLLETSERLRLNCAAIKSGTRYVAFSDASRSERGLLFFPESPDPLTTTQEMENDK